ncbi:hypothetical protein ACLBOM_11235 [Escherichia coli]
MVADPQTLCFGSLAAIFTVPILAALQNVSSPYAAFGLATCALLIVKFLNTIQWNTEG